MMKNCFLHRNFLQESRTDTNFRREEEEITFMNGEFLQQFERGIIGKCKNPRRKSVNPRGETAPVGSHDTSVRLSVCPSVPKVFTH